MLQRFAHTHRSDTTTLGREVGAMNGQVPDVNPFDLGEEIPDDVQALK
jgi:hypothetical protein